MKKYRLDVTVQRVENGRYLAVASNLRGCLAEGDTIAEALDYIEDAARVLIELSLEKGLALPPELQIKDEPPVVKAELVVSVRG